MSTSFRDTFMPIFMMLAILFGAVGLGECGRRADENVQSDWQRRCRDSGGTIAETYTERGIAGWVCVPPNRDQP